jgi:HK97 family phage portal protein
MYNWLSRLFGKRRGLRPAPQLEAVAVHNTFVWPNLAEAQAHTTIYRQSPWVYVAINRIAEAAALVPLHVFRVQGERRAEVERHPLERLLDAPNPYISRFELMEQTFGLLELTGNAYWFLAGDSSGRPTQIWPLRPDRVSIVPDPADYVRGYLYEIDGQRIPLEAQEVVHFKRWHPANDYYGLSTLEAARLAVESDRAMADWNRNTFGKDNGVPAGIVTVKDTMSPADFERIKREWTQSYGGPQRRTAFLRGSDIVWQNIGLSHSELDFLKGREAHRNDILNIYGIPVGLVSENATEANAQVAERMFVERTLWPKLVRVAQKLTQELLPFWPGEHIAEFEDIRPTDAQARLEEIRVSYPVLSVNEIRERYYRLPGVEWGALPVGAEKTHAEEQRSRDTEEMLTNEAGTPPAEPAGKSVIDELWRWERFALKRHGRANGRPFEVQNIPDDIAFEVSAGLLAAESTEDVRQVFKAARESVHTQSAP